MNDKPIDFTIEQLGEPKHLNPLSDGQHDYYFREESDRLLIDPKVETVNDAISQGITPASTELTGARKHIFFNPAASKAAIITCGGLCPGLNAVIRGAVMHLWYVYGCRNIVGIRYGYQGLGNEGLEPVILTPDVVSDIQSIGGTILGTSRGTPPTEELVDNLIKHRIDQLYVIGGDGTMRGANLIWKEIRKRKLNVSVIGVPKTIDNDIPYVSQSFGFDTAVSEASEAINSCETEAKGINNGIGLIKLMGRHAGFIAANAALASGNANICLIPEVDFKLEGKDGLYSYLEYRLQRRKHVVVAVAEGAGQKYVPNDAVDKSGNRKLGDIGTFLAENILQHFSTTSRNVSLKYIEPSYLIRSAPPTPSDQLYCDRLARSAVNAGMAGKGGMLIGNWHGHLTHMPMTALEGQSKNINPHGSLWLNVCVSTGQPYSLR